MEVAMSFNFEEFTLRNSPASSKVMRVSLHQKGRFSMNEAAFDALGKPEAIALLYDKGRKAIGFKAVEPELRHAYTVRKQKKSKSYLVGSIAFCQHYGIDASKTRAFEPVLDNGILVLELDKAIDVAPRAPRNGKAKVREPELAHA
jgi:hypothetical protein